MHKESCLLNIKSEGDVGFLSDDEKEQLLKEIELTAREVVDIQDQKVDELTYEVEELKQKLIKKMFNRLFNKQFKSDKNDSVAIVLHVITDENDEYITNLGIDSEDLEDRSLNNIGSVVVRKTWEVARKKQIRL